MILAGDGPEIDEQGLRREMVYRYLRHDLTVVGVPGVTIEGYARALPAQSGRR